MISPPAGRAAGHRPASPLPATASDIARSIERGTARSSAPSSRRPGLPAAGGWSAARSIFSSGPSARAIELAETAHDPAVWTRVGVREADGRPARGLFVGDGPDANPRSSLNDSVPIVTKDYSCAPGGPGRSPGRATRCRPPRSRRRATAPTSFASYTGQARSNRSRSARSRWTSPAARSRCRSASAEPCRGAWRRRTDPAPASAVLFTCGVSVAGR